MNNYKNTTVVGSYIGVWLMYCQGGLSGHQVVNGQTYTTRHTDYYVGTDQGPREPRAVAEH